MGRSAHEKSIRLISHNSRKLAMATKEQLSTLPTPDGYSRPDISIKVLRSLARRKAHHRGGVRPIYYAREVALSPLYKKEVREKYICQIFTGVNKIGQGCFGDVFRACSRVDGNMYAIKVTNDTHPFIDYGEVRRLEKIPDHDNCIKFYMAWQETYRLYIQMELCLTSLDKIVMVYHHIDERHCWEIFLDVAQGLKHLHDHELIHLDIKPANVMITSTGVCKIGDFGLLMDLQEMDVEASKSRGVSVSEGDGKYVALEVLCEKMYTKAADIFSLGLMMLEIASDVCLPTSGNNWRQIREGGVPNCYLDRPLTENFRDLIQRMTLKDYAHRPTVNDILGSSRALEIYKLRQQYGRPNYMMRWEEDLQDYKNKHPENHLDIPVIQVEGPSPPRRSYPIKYVPPNSPVRNPLQELDSSLLGSMVNESAPPARTDQRYARARNIARRLFQ